MLRPFYTLLLAGGLLATSCNSNSSNDNNAADQRIDLTTVVNTDNAWKHLVAFQKIADENNNNRSVGSPGGIATVDYILGQLKALGLEPYTQVFTNGKGVKGRNVIVDIKGKLDKVTMIGGHFDSVEHGPGINDNATGVAVLLEMINQIVKNKVIPNHSLRFAFWDSEEENVAGSRYYVKELSAEEKGKLVNYINIDMVGTGNPTLLITDGDGSSWKTMREDMLKDVKADEERKEIEEMLVVLEQSYPKQVAGADKLEQLYVEYLKDKNMNYKDDYLLSNNSDVFAFLGIVPAFGIVMTNEQEMEDGGLLYAPCYHQKCDDIKNVDKKSFAFALNSITYLVQKIAF